MRLKKKIRISADFLIGGEGGDRTLDPRLMSPLLYRLSYLAPCSESNSAKYIKIAPPKSMPYRLEFRLNRKAYNTRRSLDECRE